MEMMMVAASDSPSWRLTLARKIARAYAANDNARVVQIAGSVGRGTDDRYSDIEIDVYYERPPTEEERIAAIRAAGGRVADLDYGEDEWAETMLFGDGANAFAASTSTFLLETMEEYLAQVVERAEVAPLAQTRLYSLQQAQTVKGEEQVAAWRRRAARYPDALVQAMLAQNLDFSRLWYAGPMHAARDDLLAVYQLLVDVERQIIQALLGLNRIYLPSPDPVKHLEEMVAAFQHAPAGLGWRLKQVFGREADDAVAQLQRLVEELWTVVEAVEPAFDLAGYRTLPEKQRVAWDEPPEQ